MNFEKAEIKIFVGNDEIREFDPQKTSYKRTLAYNTKRPPNVSAVFIYAGKREEAVVTNAQGCDGVASVYLPLLGITYTVEFSTLYKEVEKRTPATPFEARVKNDSFWSERLNKYLYTTSPYAIEELKKQGAIQNFESVINGKGEPLSTPWEEGLLYETISGASDLLSLGKNDTLEALIDGCIDVIYKASMSSENGYLSTHAMLTQNGRYFDDTNDPIFLHECYNFGCLAEAGVKYYRATGKDRLLYVALRFGEFICDNYGYGKKKDGTEKEGMVPSHSLTEETVTELYELLISDPLLIERMNSYEEKYPLSIDPERYADLVKYFVENRGNRVKRKKLYGRYAQDRLFYFDQKEAEGHAVRANLFYTGLATAGYAFDNTSYLGAAKTIYDNITLRQMYINGSTGSREKDEAFDGDFSLSNSGYCETCASVALAFFAHRMSLSFIDSSYAELIENIMYNAVLGGISEDGRHFYYIQPLNSQKNERWSWHGCPCCVPMFLKFMSRIGSYCYSYSNDKLFVNQFISSDATLPGGITVEQVSTLPYNGVGKISVSGNVSELYIRLPQWAKSVTLKRNGKDVKYTEKSGYAVIKALENDVIEYNFEMKPERAYADERVSADIGRVALKYGPLLYCIEEADNTSFEGAKASEDAIVLPRESTLCAEYNDNLFGGTVTLSAKVICDGEEKTAVAIPFFLRSNRGGGFAYTFIKE